MAVTQQRRGANQRELTLLLYETTDRDQAPRAIGQRHRGGEFGRLNTTMDDLDALPIRRIGPSAKLAAPELPDCQGKSGIMVFRIDRERMRTVEFLTPVGGETLSLIPIYEPPKPSLLS